MNHRALFFVKIFIAAFLLCYTSSVQAQICNGIWGAPIINQTFGQGQGSGPFYGPLSQYAPGATTSTNFIYSQISDNYSCLTPNASNGQSGGTWVNVKDHTGNANGLMFLINAPSTAATVFFEYTMNNLCPNTVMQLSVWMLNVNDPSLTSNANYQYPNMQINVVDVSTGTVIATSSTGNVPADRGWHNYVMSFNNNNNASLKMQLVNYSVGSGYGNDLALDDIAVRPCVPIARVTPKLDTVVCRGTTFNFNASITGSVYATPEYSWQYSSDKGATWQSGMPSGPSATYNFAPNDTGTYWVRFLAGPTGFSSNSNCASSSDTTIVRVVNAPLPPTVENDTLCTGEALPAPVVSGTNVRWYDVATGGIGANLPPAIVTTVPGTQTLYASQTSIYGCESPRSPMVITIMPGLDMDPLHDTSVCRGNSIQLAASGATQYLWIPANGLSCSTCANPVATPTQTIKYTVVGTNNMLCFDTVSMTVHVDSPIAAFDVDKHTFCQDEPLVVHNNSQGSTLTYKWYLGDGDTSAAFEPTHTYTQPGSYTISLLVENGKCRDSVADRVVVDTAGTLLRFTTDTDGICAGRSVTFTPEYGPGTAAIVWTYGDNTDSVYAWSNEHAYNQPGAMIVTATGKYRSCPDLSFSDTIVVFADPLVNIGPDTAICPNGNPIELKNLNDVVTGNTYHWSTGEDATSISLREPGTYYLVVSANGCTTTDTVLVRRDCFIEIPNAFSPNGDGVNDYFFPKQFLASGVNAFHMQVYDRWGKIIFETNGNNGRGWDGTFNDRPQPEGIYVYMIEATLGTMGTEKYQGNVTLIR